MFGKRESDAERLASLGQGEFYLLREAKTTGVKVTPSLIRTERLFEERIAELAKSQK